MSFNDLERSISINIHSSTLNIEAFIHFLLHIYTYIGNLNEATKQGSWIKRDTWLDGIMYNYQQANVDLYEQCKRLERKCKASKNTAKKE